VPVVLDSRQQQFAARLASAREGSNRKETYNHPTSGAPICRVINNEQELGLEAEPMRWPHPHKEPAVKTVILSDDPAAKIEVKRWPSETEAKVGVGVWMWRTDGSRSDEGRVGAAAVCKLESIAQPSRHWLNGGLPFRVVDHRTRTPESVKERDRLHTHGGTKIAVVSNSQAAI